MISVVAMVLLSGTAAQPPADPKLSGSYADAAARILGAELVQGQAYPLLAHLTDRIGPRLSGSPEAEVAVGWAASRLKAFGFDARTEPVTVPHWVRGEEVAQIVAPVKQSLVITALGGSDPTPPEGITAPLVEVADFDALHALGEDSVRGRIVFFNKAMGSGIGYAAVAPLRQRGAVEAARLGAVACLVRSIGTRPARLPHTGAMQYEPSVPRIPAAALAAEDADLLHRLLESGEPVQVRLRLGCRSLPDVPSSNVVADLVGREKPDEIVLIGGHIDSWDLGPGATDDAAGVAMVMETLRLLKSLGLTPGRTLRAVIFMNEENGLRGGRAYAEAHRDELPKHVAALEADGGVGRPEEIGGSTGPGGVAMLQGIARLLECFGPMRASANGGGADISPLRAASVPALSIDLADEDYMSWHHTAADTLDKVDRRELAEATAALAIAAYVLADMPATLPRPPAPEGAHP